MHILLLDNIDSFTYNLVDALRSLGHRVTVVRNSHPLAAVISWVEREHPDLVVLSPGPGNPADSRCMMGLIEHLSGRLPILGICLGHQAIALAAGGRVRCASKVRHGKASSIKLHVRHALFRDLGSTIQAARYHSLVVDALPDEADVLAYSEGEIMAFALPALGQIGLQFHPESILTTQGDLLLKNAIDCLSEFSRPVSSTTRERTYINEVNNALATTENL